jgi:CheY-like chemotaxis protein
MDWSFAGNGSMKSQLYNRHDYAGSPQDPRRRSAGMQRAQHRHVPLISPLFMTTKREQSDAKLKGKHILIVEDHPLMGELLTDLLKMYDHASHAPSGKEALKQIEQQTPDIILLDLTLPDVSGLELTRIIRRNKKTKSTPILAMSGHPSNRECLEAGCNDFIRKPFSTEDLLDHLARLVSQQ